MIESNDVLGLMKVVYVIYVTAVFSMLGLFVYGLTHPKKVKPGFKVSFYGWIGLLVFTGVGIHVLTFHKIPWVKWDLGGKKIEVDREYDIAVGGHNFRLPDERVVIREGDLVRFNIESVDYVYGFGLFREDGTMVFQMQVLPGRSNEIVWKFDEPAVYTIRSTEYSGPRGGALKVENAVVVASNKTLARLESETDAEIAGE